MSKRRRPERIPSGFNRPPEYYPYFYWYPENNRGGYTRDGYSPCWGIKWIYALLLLILIVLQFGRNPTLYQYSSAQYNECQGCEHYQPEYACTYNYGHGDYQLIDNSVLFLIVIFLLVFCGGCWPGCSDN